MNDRGGREPAASAQLPHDRFGLGFACARGFGVVFTLSTIVNLVVPEFDRIGSFGATLLCLVVMTVCFARLGRGRTTWWAAGVYAAGLAALGTFLLPGAQVDTAATVASVTVLSSAAIPSFLVSIADRPVFPLVSCAAVLPVMGIAVVVSAPFGRSVFVALAVVAGWAAIAFVGLWLAHSAKRAAVGIGRLRQGYSDERRSTEKEAELRYGARVLHDTVLASLTVIAHSGEGASAEALRKQAANDARLLEQLRVRGVVGLRPEPPVRPSAAALQHPALASRELHETVDDWCRERNFSVTWYGDTSVAAAEQQRDALVRAVLASLSNVRAHSGTQSAEITVSHTENLIRAVVTDLGVGFERERVPPARLGVAQSIEARMAAAGGSARVFSSAGRGTTVLLEVPR